MKYLLLIKPCKPTLSAINNVLPVNDFRIVIYTVILLLLCSTLVAVLKSNEVKCLCTKSFLTSQFPLIHVFNEDKQLLCYLEFVA